MNVARKIALTLSVLGVLIAIAAALAVVPIALDLVEVGEFHAAALQEILDIEADMNGAVQQSLGYVVSGNVSEKEEFQSWDRSFVMQADAFVETAKLNLLGEENEFASFERIKVAQRLLVAQADVMFDDYDASGSVREETFEAYEELVEILEQVIEAFVDIERNEMAQAQRLAQVSLRRAIGFLILLGSLALLSTIVLGRIFSKWAQKDIRASNARRKSILAASIDPMITIDRHGVILSTSDSVETVFGWMPDEVVGRNISMLMPEPYQSEHDGYLEAYQQTGKTNILGNTREFSAVRKDGTVFPCNLTVSRVDVPDEASPIFTGIIRDITDQKRAEMLIRESEERTRLLLDSTMEGIYGLDLEGNCTFCNPSCLKILRYDSENELLGKNMHDLIHHSRPDGSPYPVEECRIFDAFREGKGSHVDDEVFWRADGSSFEAEYSSYPVQRDGAIIGSVVTFADITVYRAAQRDKEELAGQLRHSRKQEALGTLAGGIAHDFNNILMAITGFGHLAYEDAPEGTLLRESLEEIIEAADRGAKLVDQILTFSRKTEEDRKPVEFQNIVEEALRLLRPSLPSNIDIKRHFDLDSSTIFADATQMHQVIVNLFTNAAAAVGGDDGEIEVTLEKYEVDQDFAAFHAPLRFGPHLRFRVRDTGCGIAPEILDRIFEPFFTTKDVGKGTGMGLAVVHAIVDSHGGAMTVESELEKGTTFTILLPEGIESTQAEGQIDESHSTGNGKGRILLVDDEESLLRLQARVLSQTGYDVIPMRSSTKALQLFLSDPQYFDLVITDLTMPEMTGDVLASRVLGARSDIGVILCTGYSEKMGREQALAMGIRRYIKKPVSPRALAESVRQVLQEV